LVFKQLMIDQGFLQLSMIFKQESKDQAIAKKKENGKYGSWKIT